MLLAEVLATVSIYLVNSGWKKRLDKYVTGAIPDANDVFFIFMNSNFFLCVTDTN